MRRLKKGCPGLIIAFRAMELFIIFPYFLARMRTMVKKIYMCADRVKNAAVLSVCGFDGQTVGGGCRRSMNKL